MRGLDPPHRHAARFEIVVEWPIAPGAPTVQDVAATMNDEDYAAAVDGALAGRLHHAAKVSLFGPLQQLPTQPQQASAGVKGTVTVRVAAPVALDDIAILREIPEAIERATRRFLTDTLPPDHKVRVQPLDAAMRRIRIPAHRAIRDVLRAWSRAGPPARKPAQVAAPGGGGPEARSRVLNDRYGMRLTVGQLNRITLSDRNNGEDVLDRYYGWRNDRAMSIAKGMGTAVASVLVAWLIPLLQNDYEGTPEWLVVGPPCAVLLASSVWALWSFRRLDRIHQSYVTSVALLQDLRP